MPALFTLGLTLRLVAARWLSFHVDEQFSLLAAHTVAARGIPLLPSGVPYLHGATLSYLLAPLLRFGIGDLSDLRPLRFVSAGAGALTVVLAYGLARDLIGVRWAALLAAVPVALDPLGVQWGAYVRMYALLQALVVAVLWIFLRIVRDGPTVRRAIGLVVAFWAATFTHVEVVVLLPPMVLVALAQRDRRLPGARGLLAAALGASALAPLALIAATHTLSAAPDRRLTTLPDTAVLGEHLIHVGHVLQPDLADWRGLFAHNAFADLMPALLAVLSGVLIARCVFPADGEVDGVPPRRVVAALLACYWLPILAVATFTVAQQPRHLLFLQPLGSIIIAVAAAELVRGIRSARPTLARVGVSGLALLALAAPVGGLQHLANHRVVDADYASAVRYVADHHAPGQPVVSAFTPVAYLALGAREDLRYLVRLSDGSLLQSYTVRTAAGAEIDRWVGSPAVASLADLCRLLEQQPESWVIADEVRLDAPWGYHGTAAAVVRGATVRVYDAGGGAFVARPAPMANWSPAARDECQAAT